jgi:hypothetical protein
MPFFASTVKPTSFVMMMFPGTEDGQKLSVNESVSDSVAGSTSHDGAFASTVTAVDAALAGEFNPALIATVVKVYAVPAVKPVMVHEPDAPVTVHVAPPGDAVTTYDVGVRPLDGAVTVMVALSSPATTAGVPGAFGSGREGAMFVTVIVKES